MGDPRSAHACPGAQFQHVAVRGDRCGQDGEQPAGAGVARHRKAGSFRPIDSQADWLWQRVTRLAGDFGGIGLYPSRPGR